MRLSLKDAVLVTYKREGFKGFYGGLVPDLIKALPTNMVLMLCFEYFRGLMGKHDH